MSALTVDLRVASGVTLTPRLACFLGFGYDHNVSSPSASVGGMAMPASDASLDHLTVGPGLTYSWSSTDSISLAVVASRLGSSMGGKSGSTDWGYGLRVGAAKDWSVGGGVRVGLTSELGFDLMTDSYTQGTATLSEFTWLVGVLARR